MRRRHGWIKRYPSRSEVGVPTLVEMVIPEAPQNLIGDNAYDSDKLDEELRRYGIELIAPHRSNRKTEHKTYVVCDATGDAGRLSGCLPGYKTSADAGFWSQKMPTGCTKSIGSPNSRILKVSWNSTIRTYTSWKKLDLSCHRQKASLLMCTAEMASSISF